MDEMTMDGLYDRVRAGDAARPLVTFYDDATGERTELSVATFENWTAKTAGLILDGMLLDAGARVAVALPVHWQAWVWVAACVRARAVAVLDGGGIAGADAVVAGPETLQAGLACAGERLATSLRPMAGRFAEVPDGYEDYVAEALAQPDAFGPRTPDAATGPVLEVGGAVWMSGRLAAEAADAAGELGLVAGDRLLVEADELTWPTVRFGLLAPLHAAASVVLVRHAGAGGVAEHQARQERRIAAERITRHWQASAGGTAD